MFLANLVSLDFGILGLILSGLTMVAFGMIGRIDGGEGANIFGKDNFDLGPGFLDLGEKLADVAASTGTVAMTSGANAITGTGTAFTTDYAEGDWINIVGMGIDLQIANITSATAMTTVQNADATVTGAVHKRVDQVDLGFTDAISFTITEKKTELKSIQTGDNAANRATTGYEASIKTMLAEATLYRLSRVSSCWKLFRNATTAEIEGAAFTFDAYSLDSDKWQPLYISLQEGNDRTVTPNKIIKFPRVVGAIDGEFKLDATSQKMVSVTFNVYADTDNPFGGAAVIAQVGNLE